MGDGERKKRFYKQIILLKPNEIIGGKRRDLGFLPGSLYEKMSDHIAPYQDAHKISILGDLFPFDEMFYHPKYTIRNLGGPRDEKLNQIKIGPAHLPPINIFEMTYTGFMRGRTFTDSLF